MGKSGPNPVKGQEVNSSIYETVSRMNFCKACWCNKVDSIDCSVPNHITSIPILKLEEVRRGITEIHIENQSNFTSLSQDSLKRYPNVEKLTITHSGIHIVPTDAFVMNRNLKEINLRNNKIQVLPWKVFDGLIILELSLEGNPLACNCSHKWIQRQQQRGEDSILGPERDRITCLSDNKTLLFSEVDIPDCDVASVTVWPEEVTINETDSVELSCKAIGTPKPMVFWNTTALKSNFSTWETESLRTIQIEPIVNCTDCDSVKTVTEVTVTLRLEDSHGADNGYISCVAENVAGKSKNTSLLHINSSPQIISLILSRKFYWCVQYRVTGYPTRERLWYFNNQPLNLTDNKDLQDSPLPEPVPKGSVHYLWYDEGCLQIKRETSVYEGIYTLVVQNEMGIANRSIEVSLHKDKLPKPVPGKVGLPPAPPIYPVTPNGEDPDGKNKSLGVIAGAVFACLGIICMITFAGLFLKRRKDLKRRIPLQEPNSALALRERMPLNSSRLVENVNYCSEEYKTTNGTSKLFKNLLLFPPGVSILF